MAKDEKGGKAKDAAPERSEEFEKAQQKQKDELAARRARQEKGDPLGDDSNGKSVEERAAEGETEEEPDGQFAFVSEDEQGRRLTFGTFIPRNTPIEYRITMGSKSNVLRGKLLDPTEDVMMLVRGKVSEGNVKFTRDEHENIQKATIYLVIAPKTVINAKTEQAAVMLHGEPPTSAAGG